MLQQAEDRFWSAMPLRSAMPAQVAWPERSALSVSTARKDSWVNEAGVIRKKQRSMAQKKLDWTLPLAKYLHGQAMNLDDCLA